MWIYKINAKKYKKHNFWRIPKNCVNAANHNFETLLTFDDKAIVKSALCNWFSDKIKGADFCIGMNGYHSIYLQSDKESEEFDFINFNVIGDYLLHHTNEIEYNKVNFLVKRVQKLNRIVSKIK